MAAGDDHHLPGTLLFDAGHSGQRCAAAAVKKAGVLRVGGTRTSFLFSQLDETDNSLRGFDAGLYQLLARYILGDRTGIDTAPAAPAVG